MYPFPFPSKSKSEGLRTPAALLSLLTAQGSEFREALSPIYGENLAVLTERATAIAAALTRFQEAFGELPCAIYRAPARISLNPHCDHQGAWVPYGLHVRELLAVMAPAPDDTVHAINVDPTFAEELCFRASEETSRSAAWSADWLPYVEAPEVVAEVRRNLDLKAQQHGRRATKNYLCAGYLRLRHLFPAASIPGLRLALNGNIPQGGGLSSSSALVVLAALAAAEFAGIAPERSRLAEWCGEAEWYVGTRGGSGDHAAMLLGSREGLTHLCFQAPVAVRGVRRSPFPAEYQLILANSQTRSEKSAEERLLFNRGVFAYRFAFLALKEVMRELCLPNLLVEQTGCLGDLHTGRISEADLYRLLLRLPEAASPAELAHRFPDRFSAAARSCFGTDDLSGLPQEIPLRGAAAFGLGRVDRGRVMPELLEQADQDSMQEFGRLMSLTHDGDRLFRNGSPYAQGRDRLQAEALQDALRAAEAGAVRPLRNEPGYYGASIAELDRLVDAAERVDGVLGAGLMGAGGGGYVLILARRGALPAIRRSLISEYYRPLGKEPEVEAWHPMPAAGRIL